MSARALFLRLNRAFISPDHKRPPLHLHEDRREAAARYGLRQAICSSETRNLISSASAIIQLLAQAHLQAQGVVARRQRLTSWPQTLPEPPLTQLWPTTVALMQARQGQDTPDQGS